MGGRIRSSIKNNFRQNSFSRQFNVDKTHLSPEKFDCTTHNYKDLFTRNNKGYTSPDYYSEISKPAFRPENAAYEQWNTLLKNCLTHHAEYVSGSVSDSLVFQSQSKSKFISEDNLSNYFLESCYIKPFFCKLVDDDEPDDKDFVVTYDEFCESVSESPITVSNEKSIASGSNKITILTGDVGVGKTTFIKKMNSDFLSKLVTPDSNGYSVVPVYVDACRKLFRDSRSVPDPINEDFYVYFVSKILEGITDSDLEQTKTLNIPAPKTEPIKYLKLLTRELRVKKIRLLIIFDGLDIYHYPFIKHAFFEKYFSEQYKSVCDNIIGLIKLFSSDELRNYGLCVVFVCRTYINKFIKIENVQNPGVISCTSYQIKYPKIEDVVTPRVKLINASIDVIKKNKNELYDSFKESLALINPIFTRIDRDDLDDNPGLRAIYKLSHRGFRSFVSFLSQIDYHSTNYEINKRLIEEQPRTFIMLYILNRRKKYSQTCNHFPNMFLNDAVIQPNDRYPDAYKPHKHTYWLKYFILKYIKSQGSTTLDSIVKLFVNQWQYEEHLVLLALGSLCTSDSFRCVSIDHIPVTSDHHIFNLKLTSRGDYLLQPNSYKYPSLEFVFSFTYLQLIIDDYLVAFPIDSFANIYIEENYDFLLGDHETYSRCGKVMVEKKAMAVINFFTILKASLYAEIQHRKINKSDIIIPDCDAIGTQLTQQISVLFDNWKIQTAKPTVTISYFNKYFKFFNMYYASKIDVQK